MGGDEQLQRQVSGNNGKTLAVCGFETKNRVVRGGINRDGLVSTHKGFILGHDPQYYEDSIYSTNGKGQQPHKGDHSRGSCCTALGYGRPATIPSSCYDFHPSGTNRLFPGDGPTGCGVSGTDVRPKSLGCPKNTDTQRDVPPIDNNKQCCPSLCRNKDFIQMWPIHTFDSERKQSRRPAFKSESDEHPKGANIPLYEGQQGRAEIGGRDSQITSSTLGVSRRSAGTETHRSEQNSLWGSRAFDGDGHQPPSLNSHARAILGQRRLPREAESSDAGSLCERLEPHSTYDSLDSTVLEKREALRRAEKGMLRRETAAVKRGDANNKYPLHLKKVGFVDWVTVLTFLRNELVTLYAAFADHLRWFTDPDFLTAQTNRCREHRPNLPIWSGLEDLDIMELLRRFQIREVSKELILAWCVVFTVLEILKERRRLITAPELNEGSENQVRSFEGIEIATVEVARVAVLMERAFHMDFPWFFGQFRLSESAQRFYGFAHHFNDGCVKYFVLVAVPTGSRFVPLLAQTLALAISRSALRDTAKSALMTEREIYAQTTLDVCLDNCRIAGRTWIVDKASRFFETRCRLLGLTTNEPVGELATQYTFLGVSYDHVTGCVQTGTNMVTKLKNMFAELQSREDDKSSFKLRDLLRFLGVLVYTSRIHDIHAGPFYHFYACLRRKLNRSTADLDSSVSLWAAAAQQLRAWLVLIMATQQTRVNLETNTKFSLFTDASLRGWGAVLIAGPCISSCAEAIRADFSDTTMTMTTQCGIFYCSEIIAVLEARAVLYGLRMFSTLVNPRRSQMVRTSPARINCFVDNESVRYALTKGRSNNYAINSIIIEIVNILDRLQCEARWIRIPSANNIADCLTRIF
jgi:hypothetical protein